MRVLPSGVHKGSMCLWRHLDWKLSVTSTLLRIVCPQVLNQQIVWIWDLPEITRGRDSNLYNQVTDYKLVWDFNRPLWTWICICVRTGFRATGHHSCEDAFPFGRFIFMQITIIFKCTRIPFETEAQRNSEMADWIMTQAQVHYDTHGKAPSLTILFNFVFCNLFFRFFWRVACFIGFPLFGS